MDKLVMTWRGGKICTAAAPDGKVSQLTLEPDIVDSLLNNIYIGKVQKVVSDISAASIDIGLGCTRYYSLQECWKLERLKAGNELVVQVNKGVAGTKAPMVTGRLSFTGRYCVLAVRKTGIGFSAKIRNASYEVRLCSLLECSPARTEDLGVIVRTNAATVKSRIVREGLAELMGTWQRSSADVVRRVCYNYFYRALPGYVTTIRDSLCGTLEEIVTDIPEYHRELGAYLEMYRKGGVDRLTLYEDSPLLFSKLYSLETAFEEALGKNVWFKFGGYLVIESTKTTTVIDMNARGYSDRKNTQDIICRTNMEVVDETGRQLGLRNLSGIIIVDFIDMEKEEDRKTLLAHLGDVVSEDLVKTMAVDITALNPVEFTRKEMRRSLHEQA